MNWKREIKYLLPRFALGAIVVIILLRVLR
jgi:hypothetical protein